MQIDRLEKELEEIVSPYMKNRPNLKLTIGMVKEGERAIFSKGKLKGYEERDPENILYEIGSISKVFTASLLAKAITEKRVDLDDSIVQYIPTLAQNKTLNQNPVTLRHLTTHTTGLPSIPFKFALNILFSKEKRKNPYLYFTDNDLLHFLENYKFGSKRSSFKYSNLGVGLLGYILSKVYKNDYESIIQAELCKPLNLKNTTIHLSSNQKLNLVPGFDQKNRKVSNWDFNSLEGAGALRSTIKDQLIFLENHMEPDRDEFNRMLSKTHQILLEEKKISVGMNWIIDKEKNIIWHNGGTGGYSSFMGFNKGKKRGIVILSNYTPSFSKDQSVDNIGFGLLELLGNK